MNTKRPSVTPNPLQYPWVKRDLRRLSLEQAKYITDLLSEPDDWDEFDVCEYEPDGEDE